MFNVTLIVLSYCIPIALRKWLLQCQFIFALIMGVGLVFSPTLNGLWGYLMMAFPMWVLGSISALCIGRILNE